MKINENYFRVWLERDVPTSVLLEKARILRGKTEKEQDELREMWAKEFEAKYPLTKRDR